MMRVTAMLLCAAMLLSLLAGCGSGGAYVPTGNALEDETTPVTAPTVQAEKTEYSLAYDVDEGFNPYAVTSISNQMIFSLVYQGLFAVDRDYQAEGILCKSYTVTRDLSTYTFTLEDAVFSDGSVLTAADVVASLEAARESQVYGGRFDLVESVEALEDGRVRIELSCSCENFPLLLDIPIVRASQTDAEHPVGTGPYILSKDSRGYILTRRGSWWCSAKLSVEAETVQLRGYQTAADIRDGFQFEDVGISIADPGQTGYAEYRSDCELWDVETGIFLYLGTKIYNSVFSDDNIRRALAYAIDREEILNECYRGFGHAATLPASPVSPYYDKNLAETVYYDPEELKLAVETAGQVGASVVLIAPNDDLVRLSAARRIVRMLNECGLVAELIECSDKEYTERLETGNYDLYLGQTKLSATMDLTQFYSSKGALNYGNMADSSILNLCRKALENSGNYYDLHARVIEDGQLVPILFRTYALYVKRNVFSELSPSRDNVFYYSLGKPAQEIMSVAQRETDGE